MANLIWQQHAASLKKNRGGEWEMVLSRGLMKDFQQEVLIANYVCDEAISAFKYVRYNVHRMLGYTQSKRKHYIAPQSGMSIEEKLELERLQEDYTAMGKKAFTAMYCPDHTNPNTFGTWASKAFKCADNSYRSSNAAKQKGVKRKNTVQS